MKSWSKSFVILGALVLPIAPAHAQLGGLFDSIADEAADAIAEEIGVETAGAEPASDGPQVNGSRLTINTGSDFAAGTHVVVATDFAGVNVGAMPEAWKTNGAGQIVTAGGLPGKWLSLQRFATYKLATPPALPERFTIEFDLVPVADTLRDARGVLFGFTHNNSVQSYVPDAYNDGAITATRLNFGGNSSVASSATGTSHIFDFEMDGYVNQPMHISIAVDDDRGRIYVDGTKIGDARLFDGNRAKYFFISGPTRFEHGAALLFGNFRIATFE